MQPTDPARRVGTALRGYIILPYSTLEAAFGPPNHSDSHKISTGWVLEHNNTIITIYDWKETHLYSPELPSVSEFRQRPRYCWHVGGLPNMTPPRLLAQHFSDVPDLEWEEL